VERCNELNSRCEHSPRERFHKRRVLVQPMPADPRIRDDRSRTTDQEAPIASRNAPVLSERRSGEAVKQRQPGRSHSSELRSRPSLFHGPSSGYTNHPPYIASTGMRRDRRISLEAPPNELSVECSIARRSNGGPRVDGRPGKSDHRPRRTFWQSAGALAPIIRRARKHNNVCFIDAGVPDV
jgi:hypothetical protein